MTDSQELVWNAKLPCVVLGRGGTACLIPLDGKCYPAKLTMAREFGYHFVGAVGLIEGKPKIAFCDPMAVDDPAIMIDGVHSYAAYVAHALDTEDPAATSSDWLQKLFDLPDARN